MPESQSGRQATQHTTDDDRGPVQYPTHHIVGIVDTPEQATCTLDTLARGGFLESEITFGYGAEEAERLHAVTGRHGLQDLIIRLAQNLGMTHDEIEVKNRYERALREGHIVVAIYAPSEERKALATQMVQGCGGYFVNYFGPLSRQLMVP